MADKRKLQMEIDRTMKKVEEGVELFDEIWEKVYSARDPNHKEKYEADLKKEIKKLQRQRDQIKTWLAGNDIKDKKTLIETRKLIESKMEQFKVCEKEAKTKMFSKEGLAREQKVDPREAAKNNTRDWLGQCLSNLNTQIESFDADLEKLTSGKGRNKNKEEIATLEGAITRHRWHVAKLEQIIRLIDNDHLNPSQVDDIKDDVEYFVESNQEPDFQDAYDESTDLYEALDLDDAPLQVVDLITREKSANKEDDEEGGGDDGVDDQEDEEKSQSSSKSDKKKGAGVPSLTIGRGAKNAPVPQSSPPSKPSPSPITLRTGNIGQLATGRGGSRGAATVVPPPVPSVTPRGGATAATTLKSAFPTTPTPQLGKPHAEPEQAQPTITTTQASPVLAPTTTAQMQSRLQPQQVLPQGKAVQPVQQLTEQQRQLQLQQQAAQAAPPARPPTAGVGATAQQPTATLPTPPQTPPLLAQASPSQQPRPSQVVAPPQSLAPQPPQSGASLQQAQVAAQRARPPQQIPVPHPFGGEAKVDQFPPLGEVPGATTTEQPEAPQPPPSLMPDSPLQGPGLKTPPETLQMQMNFLNMAMLYIPTSHDSERPRQYFPRAPYPVHGSYPTQPAGIFDTPAIFEKFNTDTLFFIFYYQQGTYQQYLAARELKKQSWRYHKKYMTWFQRHEEPKITTDEYEQGTYVYFDCDSGWCQRIKTEFSFEYNFLEDELQT